MNEENPIFERLAATNRRLAREVIKVRGWDQEHRAAFYGELGAARLRLREDAGAATRRLRDVQSQRPSRVPDENCPHGAEWHAAGSSAPPCLRDVTNAELEPWKARVRAAEAELGSELARVKREGDLLEASVPTANENPLDLAFPSTYQPTYRDPRVWADFAEVAHAGNPD